jgi:hypothetical protein
MNNSVPAKAAATASAERQSVEAYKGGMFKIEMSELKAATSAMQQIAGSV